MGGRVGMGKHSLGYHAGIGTGLKLLCASLRIYSSEGLKRVNKTRNA